MNPYSDKIFTQKKFKTSCLIEQILPDIFNQSIDLKDAYVLKINKKDTGLIINFLKENNLNKDKVFLKAFRNKLKSNENSKYFSNDFEYGKFSYNLNLENKNSNILFDISFLKRVKSLNENENLILIAFLDVNFS